MLCAVFYISGVYLQGKMAFMVHGYCCLFCVLIQENAFESINREVKHMNVYLYGTPTHTFTHIIG